jgi:hypothetical protein
LNNYAFGKLRPSHSRFYRTTRRTGEIDVSSHAGGLPEPSSLADIRGRLREGYYPRAPEELFRVRGSYILTRNEVRALLKEADEWIERRKEGRATNPIYAGLVLGGDDFLQKLRQEGLFRLSRYDFRHEQVVGIVRALLKPGLGLDPKALAYVQSVSRLHEIADGIREIHQNIVDWLRSERESGLKGLLATLDCIFMVKADRGLSSDKEEFTSAFPFFFEPEELAEGYSLVLATYSRCFGPPTKNPSISRSAASRGAYHELLRKGTQIAVFREWETLVDRLEYVVDVDPKTGTYHLSAPDESLGRAVRHGFIQTETQALAKGMDWLEDGVPWFREVAKQFAEKFGDTCLVLKTVPEERYVLGIPAADEILPPLQDVELFQEERLILRQLARELLIPVEELVEVDIRDGVTVRDLLRVQRLVQFLRWVMAMKLIPVLESRYATVIQSILPFYTRELLVKLLSFAIPIERVEVLIDLLRLDLTGTGHIDVMYQPLVPSGDGFLFPMNAFANANIVRNTLMLTRRRLYEDGTNDPLPGNVARSFTSKGHAGLSNHSYSFEGKAGDVDVLALVDGILFALECKNSLLPTGPHELLTSWDHIQKGALQLDRFGVVFANPALRAKLAAQTTLPIDGSTRLVTGILMPNRMFIGCRLRGHAVRSSFELEHFIDEGTISIGEESRCFWAGDSLTGEDLRRFFEEDLTYLPFWRVMRKIRETHMIGRRKVEVDGWRLDLLPLAEELGFTETAKGLGELVTQVESQKRAWRRSLGLS